MKFRLLAVAWLLIPGALLTAQAERLTVRMSPVPNQTLRLRTTQEMKMTIEPDPASAGTRSIPAMAMDMTTVIEHTSIVGPTDSQGRYQSKLVVDNATSTMMINGQPSPMQVPMANIVGQTMTFFYDDQGNVVDVKMEGELSSQLGAPIAQLLQGAMAVTAPLSLAVGESVTRPLQLNMPLPAGAGPMTMGAETKYTLTSVTFEGSERIAHLAVTMTSGFNHDGPPAAAAAGSPLAIEFQMTGTGTTDVNIDRGIVLKGQQVMTMDGTMRSGTGNAAMPAMKMHGTITIASGVY